MSPVQHDYAIELEPFKLTAGGRGSKKVIVNGGLWGWIYMTSHGCNGPIYHLHDMHSEVTRPADGGRSRRDRTVPVTVRPNNGRHARWKAQCAGQKPPSTESILEKMVRDAIAARQLRSPAERDNEIAAAAARWEASLLAGQREAERKLTDRAQDIVFMIADGKSNDEIKAAIIDAMKWAQIQ